MYTGFGSGVCTMRVVSREDKSPILFGLSNIRGCGNADQSLSLDRSEYLRRKLMSIRKTILWHAG
jgi:hypothetical protein